MISPGTYTVILDTASFCTNAQTIEIILAALRAKRPFAIVDVFDAFGAEARVESIELSRLLTIVHHDVCSTTLQKYGQRAVVHLRDHVARGIDPMFT
jgi:hypothetical protein